ncbi:uncharacterized protein LOC111014231 [Momordica charantia]|uniref:Uncharacterized protein LOC111014231 n=1 Tax=Momordica charantia TaxID=3673 RepID=A0A6J1CS17_MOMCH|nr:uncharacterized protein LOC111014231 [Momordica charantia]
MRSAAPFPGHHNIASSPPPPPTPTPTPVAVAAFLTPPSRSNLRPLPAAHSRLESRRSKLSVWAAAVPNQRPLDLTEENVIEALVDARLELAQIFDASVGITGVVELAELDGPFVKISLRGRFWHKRSTVVARVGNYLKNRIPEILEVEIEEESQLDDSPASF